MTSLYIRTGKKFESAPAEVVLGCARELLVEHFRPGARVLDNPLLIETYLTEKLAGLEHEVFAVVLLDTYDKLIEYVEIARGTYNHALIYPREIVKVALRHNAAGVILVHNHPGGNASPSPGDIETTRCIQRTLALVDIKVIDHFIVGKKMTSFVVSGLLR